MPETIEWARVLMEKEAYDRPILGFRLTATKPDYAETVDDQTFLCYTAQEVLGRDKPMALTRHNVLCGGGVYAGLGSRPIEPSEFKMGQEMIIGPKRAYSSLCSMRKVGQQLVHFFAAKKYLVMGRVEDMEDPDGVQIVTDAHRVMRLTKAYTWKTGELVHAVGGTCWCGMSFPWVYRHKTMTFNTGDPPARMFMQLQPSELFCIIHKDLLPTVVENLDNISEGEGY